MIFKYKIHCNTENQDKFWYKDSGSPPTTCPDHTDHQVDLSSVAVIGTFNSPAEVVTQFEKRDKTLKIASGSAAVGNDGKAIVLMKIPGTPNPTGDVSKDGRWISSGIAFFDVATPGDKILSVRFVDHDNMLGAGADFVVGSYTDDDAEQDEQGWFIPPKKGEMKAEAIGGYGFAPAGFYIMVEGQKGGGLTTGTFYVNFEWGKVE